MLRTCRRAKVLNLESCHLRRVLLLRRQVFDHAFDVGEHIVQMTCRFAVQRLDTPTEICHGLGEPHRALGRRERDQLNLASQQCRLGRGARRNLVEVVRQGDDRLVDPFGPGGHPANARHESARRRPGARRSVGHQIPTVATSRSRLPDTTSWTAEDHMCLSASSLGRPSSIIDSAIIKQW